VERWNQRLVSEESAFYTQIGVGCLNASVNEESCDVLWSTAVRCKQSVRDVDQGYSASVMKQHGLLTYDGSLEAESGSLHTEG
jgi:phosphohistidine phosphatase SixA